MKQFLGFKSLLPILFVLILLSGCGSPVYIDGAYTGVSSADDDGAYAEVNITVEDGKISSCDYVTIQSDGAVKDADYGKINGEVSNQDYYNKAQLAVAAMGQYARDLVDMGDISDVDVVTGATIAYDQFREAVADALADAR
ncbi:MAG: FMN-binding protein [Clostridiales Family XIII bacterium]|jgi:major membrane immunogen (membrane-anchored lipoprotein)|nr:FMN-binding protein [Clostridiales Family XIII bacterium]